MIWKEVEEKYGKKIADRMKRSRMLMGITVTKRNGEWDIPESDIENAYRDVMGKPIPLEGWD